MASEPRCRSFGLLWLRPSPIGLTRFGGKAFIENINAERYCYYSYHYYCMYIQCIYYQMLFGIRPFGEGKSQDKLLRDHTMLNAAQVHFSDRAQVSAAGKQFIQQCLTYDQAFRPTIAQLCENPYVLQETI